MTEIIIGKEYIFQSSEPCLEHLNGSTFVPENWGHLFTDMVMGTIHGRGKAVYPHELIDPDRDE